MATNDPPTVTPDDRDPDQAGGGPTARRIMLGAQLRRLREAAEIPRAEAGYQIRASDSKISRLEAGKVGFKERDVADLLTMYGVTEARDRELLLDMARRGNQQGWWRHYGDAVPDWFQDFVGLEISASRIQTYELLFVPGLLQTEDYATAVVTQGHPERIDEQAERRIATRMRRQTLLTGRDAPTLWAVLDESVLHRPIGGTAVLGAQIGRLVELSALPNVILQVLPFQFSGYAAESSFAMLRFAEPELPDVVYLEQLVGAAYLDRRSDVETYTRVMDRLTIDALTPDQTRQLLRKLYAER